MGMIYWKLDIPGATLDDITLTHTLSLKVIVRFWDLYKEMYTKNTPRIRKTWTFRKLGFVML